MSFALPDGAGSFSGGLVAGAHEIAGHWMQPNTVINGFQYATPVNLTEAGIDRWVGQVQPVDDDCTYFLMITKRSDGAFAAFLRNPDRNLGLQFGVDRLVLAGNAVTLMGRHLDKGVEKIVAQGSFDPARQVISIVFPDRGGTYEFARDTAQLSRFYPRGAKPELYVYRAPELTQDGWSTATLDDVGIDRAGIEKFIQSIIDTPIDSVHAAEIEAILIARHGKLVLDEYFHGFNRDMHHDTRSAGKSITSVIVGAAIEAGAPLSLSTPVYKLMNGGTFPKNVGPWKEAMTLKDLLMMRAGYYCNDVDPAAPGNEDTMIDSMLSGTGDPDFYHYVLNVPMAFKPDTESVYCSTEPNLALGMVAKATGQFPATVFDRLIGGPLKIETYGWPLDGVGHTYGGGGVRIRPRDFLKIGQLMLNDGVWHGKRILGKEYVAKSSSPLHDLNMIQYGFYWWSIEYPYKNKTLRAYFAGGNGGQGIMVVPALDLVIGTFAGNYADHMGLHIQQDLAPNYILPAVRQAGDDPRAHVAERHFATPYAHPPVVAPTSLQN